MRPSSTWPAARSTDKTSWCTSWGKPQSRLQHPRAAVNLAAPLHRSLGTAAAITTTTTTTTTATTATTTTTTTTTAIGLCQTWTAGVRAGVRARRRRRRRRRRGVAGAAHRAAIARHRAAALATARAHRRRAPAARRRHAATTGGATSHDATSHGARALAHLPPLRRAAHPAMHARSCGTLTPHPHSCSFRRSRTPPRRRGRSPSSSSYSAS